jgi:hypothetical protein
MMMFVGVIRRKQRWPISADYPGIMHFIVVFCVAILILVLPAQSQYKFLLLLFYNMIRPFMATIRWQICLHSLFTFLPFPLHSPLFTVWDMIRDIWQRLCQSVKICAKHWNVIYFIVTSFPITRATGRKLRPFTDAASSALGRKERWYTIRVFETKSLQIDAAMQQLVTKPTCSYETVFFRTHETRKYKSMATQCLQAQRILPWERMHREPLLRKRNRGRIVEFPQQCNTLLNGYSTVLNC